MEGTLELYLSHTGIGPAAQISQCTSPKSHNVPICNRNVQTCGHISVTQRCIVENLSDASWDFWEMDLLHISIYMYLYFILFQAIVWTEAVGIHSLESKKKKKNPKQSIL